ncbi:hypothetical protein ABTM81_20270, partial [Acinetobacter baumannii]
MTISRYVTFRPAIVAGAAAVLGVAFYLGATERISAHALTLITDAMIFGIFALALNVLLGWTGLVSLGHSLFFA